MNLEHIDRLSEHGISLTPEERVGLRIAITQRTHEENLENPFVFWGKVFGTDNDYLICETLVETADLIKQRFYFCNTGEYILKRMPELSVEFEKMASEKTDKFKGDASFLYGGEEELETKVETEEGQPPAPVLEKFREVHRLAYTVQKIDRAVAVAPIGQFLLSSGKKLVRNSGFRGLCLGEAELLSSYVHLRNPEQAHNQSSLKVAGFVHGSSFLDSLTADKPNRVWSLNISQDRACANLRNHYWPGSFFFHKIDSQESGYVYFGSGESNKDLSFVL